MTSWFPMALRIAKFLARRHLHRLVLHLLATYSLFFPREEERIACSDARKPTMNYARFWNFQIMLDNAKNFDRLRRALEKF